MLSPIPCEPKMDSTNPPVIVNVKNDTALLTTAPEGQAMLGIQEGFRI